VHSSVDYVGLIPILVRTARTKGRSVYGGDGTNRLSAGHTLDVATLFRLAAEQAPAGSRLHGVDDEGVPLRQIAEIIAHHLDVPVESVPAEQFLADLGWVAGLAGIDNPASSTRTRELLGWKPVNPGLVEDLEAGRYFATA
jgi:nucleoside-diphosphate-sugar epimerase